MKVDCEACDHLMLVVCVSCGHRMAEAVVNGYSHGLIRCPACHCRAEPRTSHYGAGFDLDTCSYHCEHEKHHVCPICRRPVPLYDVFLFSHGKACRHCGHMIQIRPDLKEGVTAYAAD